MQIPSSGVSDSRIPEQDISIQQSSDPEEIDVVGAYYFIHESSSEANACSYSNTCEPIGMPIFYRILLLGELDQGRASNPAIDVYITDKLPFEAKLIGIEQSKSNTNSNSINYIPIQPFSGEKKNTLLPTH
jgi:hypothetical protein